MLITNTYSSETTKTRATAFHKFLFHAFGHNISANFCSAFFQERIFFLHFHRFLALLFSLNCSPPLSNSSNFSFLSLFLLLFLSFYLSLSFFLARCLSIIRATLSSGLTIIQSMHVCVLVHVSVFGVFCMD